MAAKKFAVTVHPAPLSGDYLTVSDAMHQVLDFIEALERSETVKPPDRQIVWRLTEAHTNSPPFTVIAEAFPLQPNLSVAFEAGRVSEMFNSDLRTLIEDGRVSGVLADDARAPIERLLNRNLNGIGRTDVQLGDDPPILISPAGAKIATLALERLDLERQAAQRDWQRTEFGSFEGEITGLARWNGKPALSIVDRISGEAVTCVLSDGLSNSLGPAHRWGEVWEGRLVAVAGSLFYNSAGALRRAEIEDLEEIQWADVSVADLRGLDVLSGRTLSEHLALIRDGQNG